MRKQNGFTLIELMIVVAIVGILAAIAIPAYQDFQVRSKISEVLATMGACKTSVGEYYSSNNGWTSGPAAVAIDAELCATGGAGGNLSQYVNGIVVGATGVITATSQNTGNIDADGDIQMIPVDDAGAAIVAGGSSIYQWLCGPVTVERRFLPGSCQN